VFQEFFIDVSFVQELLIRFAAVGLFSVVCF